MNQVVPEDGVDQGERIERIGGEVGHEVVLARNVDRRQRCRRIGISGCRPTERHPEDGKVSADEALEYAAVGPVGIGDEHEVDVRVHRRGDESFLLLAGHGGALGVPEHGVGRVRQHPGRGRGVGRVGDDAGSPAQAGIKVGRPGRHRPVVVQIAQTGEWEQLLRGVDAQGKAGWVTTAAQAGRLDVEGVHGADVEADEVRRFLRHAQFVEGAAHVQRGRGQGGRGDGRGPGQ